MVNEIEETLYSSSSEPSGSTDQDKLENAMEAFRIANSLLQLCSSDPDHTCTVYVRTSTLEVKVSKQSVVPQDQGLKLSRIPWACWRARSK